MKRIGIIVFLAVGLGSMLIAACNGDDTPTQTELPAVTPTAALPRPTDTPPALMELPSAVRRPTAQATATGAPSPTTITDASADLDKTPSIAAVVSPRMGTIVSLSDHADLGTILTDRSGRTLYLFTVDELNLSNCSGGCAIAWPPLLTVGDPQAGEGVNPDSLATIERDDGSTQVTYNGWPLYRFWRDAKPGDANGQGSRKAWFVVSAVGEPKCTPRCTLR